MADLCRYSKFEEGSMVILMKSLWRYIRLYRIFAVQYIKTTMQSKVDFFIGLGGFLVSQAAGIAFLYLVFDVGQAQG